MAAEGPADEMAVRGSDDGGFVGVLVPAPDAPTYHVSNLSVYLISRFLLTGRERRLAATWSWPNPRPRLIGWSGSWRVGSSDSSA